MIYRGEDKSFTNSIEKSIARKFKDATAQLLLDSGFITGQNIEKNNRKNVYITIAYRGGGRRTRSISNPDDLKVHLERNLGDYNVIIRTFDSTNNHLPNINQTHIAFQSDIIITEHRAFVSNLVYMREGSLLIELIGHYQNPELDNFQALALMFLVQCETVKIDTFRGHHVPGFVISENEMHKISGLCDHYVRSVLSIN